MRKTCAEPVEASSLPDEGATEQKGVTPYVTPALHLTAFVILQFFPAQFVDFAQTNALNDHLNRSWIKTVSENL
ncbi:MAG: hypothetical protein HFACDABA_00468 [Anaerolineales bacterium]|nr:hypothetical protein [Anaerolineales bacterium]